MRYDSLTDEEKRSYDKHLEAVQYQRSVIETGREEGREEGDKAARLSIAQTMKKAGMSPQQIADMTNLPLEEIKNMPL